MAWRRTWLVSWRRLILEAVESRFGGCRTPHPVEMLSDDGSPRIARETRVFASQLGLKPCFTPIKSPQSNGIPEAFVNTLKRDDVRVTPLPDAPAVLDAISGWFEDCNENENEKHPRSRLNIRSPHKVAAAQAETA